MSRSILRSASASATRKSATEEAECRTWRMSRWLSCAAIRPGSRDGVVTGIDLCFALTRWLVLAHIEAEDIAGKDR